MLRSRDSAEREGVTESHTIASVGSLTRIKALDHRRKRPPPRSASGKPRPQAQRRCRALRAVARHRGARLFDRRDQRELRITRRTGTISQAPGSREKKECLPVIILGVILLVIGFIVGIPVLYTIGIVLAVAGVVLAILGGTGRKVGGRAHWF